MTTAYAIPGSPASYYPATLIPAVDITPKNTHIVVEGTVSYLRKEADGDLHFDIKDANGLKLTCEIDPQNPLQPPTVGEQVRVYGVYRVDPDHGGWVEIHPCDYWEPATVAPILAS